jgi:hypothetical protein
MIKVVMLLRETEIPAADRVRDLYISCPVVEFFVALAAVWPLARHLIVASLERNPRRRPAQSVRIFEMPGNKI